MSGEATHKPKRRVVPADLIETTPDAGAAFHWALAAPLLLFLAWIWVDVFTHYSPVRPFWLDVGLAALAYAVVFVLPLGVAAHRAVTAAPRLFQHAGWDLRPLEPVASEEQYLVRYTYRERRRAPGSWRRWLMRAAQGWVYLEIATIFTGAVLMIPLFFSATEFGFGR